MARLETPDLLDDDLAMRARVVGDLADGRFERAAQDAQANRLIAHELDLVELVGDEAVGLRILRRALEAPIRQIADNAGAHGEVVVEKVRGLKPGHGYDALKGEYGDMFRKGI